MHGNLIRAESDGDSLRSKDLRPERAILGDLPILGSLFRSTNRENIRREVIVLLTPNILDDSLGASGYGSNYQLSPSAQEMLERQGYPLPRQGR